MKSRHSFLGAFKLAKGRFCLMNVNKVYTADIYIVEEEDITSENWLELSLSINYECRFLKKSFSCTYI